MLTPVREENVVARLYCYLCQNSFRCNLFCARKLKAKRKRKGHRDYPGYQNRNLFGCSTLKVELMWLMFAIVSVGGVFLQAFT